MPELPPRLHLAADHLETGRLDQARAALQRFLTAHPESSIAHAMMGSTLARLGEADRALFHLTRARAGDPHNPDLLANLGNAQLSVGDPAGAAASYSAGLAADPAHLSSTIGLINALNARMELDQADALGRDALERWPDHLELRINRATTLLASGLAAESVNLLRQTVALHPASIVAADSLAFATNYPGGLSNAEVSEAHRQYGALLPRHTHAAPRASGPDRTLRIGLLSADLRSHSVAFFIEPWLAAHDRSSFDVTCYSTALNEDETSARLRTFARRWRSVPHLPADALADAIRADAIDILLDLSGHTAGHRLPVLHRRPAPLQLTYLGYPGTTGLRAVDHRIVDATTDPRDADTLHTEHLHRLDPCFLCYQLDPAAPPADAGPLTRAATFASFNALAKLSTDTVSLWARVLIAAPGSRLILKNQALGQPGVRAQTAARFRAAGITADRLVLLGPDQSRREHLARYADVDIALDTFPYHGTATTCEALAMGVPVVTLAGDRHASRVGVSLLSAAGTPDTIATSPSDYIRIAAAQAAMGPRRAASRSALAQVFARSSLCDGADFARRFDSALRTLWKSACNTATNDADA